MDSIITKYLYTIYWTSGWPLEPCQTIDFFLIGSDFVGFIGEYDTKSKGYEKNIKTLLI